MPDLNELKLALERAKQTGVAIRLQYRNATSARPYWVELRIRSVSARYFTASRTGRAEVRTYRIDRVTVSTEY